MINSTDNSNQIVCSTDEISQFIDSIDGKVQSFEGVERRSWRRYVVAIPTLVFRLDDQDKTCGAPMRAVTRDISVGGISIIHSEPIQDERLKLRLFSPSGKTIQAFVDVRRCQPMGNYFEIAGEFDMIPVSEV